MYDLMYEFIYEYKMFLENYAGFQPGSPVEESIIICTASLIFVFIMYLTIKFLVRVLW